jgi:hypothetical protein
MNTSTRDPVRIADRANRPVYTIRWNIVVQEQNFNLTTRGGLGSATADDGTAKRNLVIYPPSSPEAGIAV